MLESHYRHRPRASFDRHVEHVEIEAHDRDPAAARGRYARDFEDMLGHRDERMFDQHYFDHRVERVIDLTEAQGRMLGG